MENIRIILNEEDNKQQMNSAINNVVGWFSTKMEQARNCFSDAKYNITKKLNSGKHWTVTADIYDRNGKLILHSKAGNKTIVDKLRELINKIRKFCEDIIRLCKKGIMYIRHKSVTEAKNIKGKVTELFKDLSAMHNVSSTIMKNIQNKADRKAEKKYNKRNRELDKREAELDAREKKLNNNI